MYEKIQSKSHTEPENISAITEIHKSKVKKVIAKTGYIPNWIP